MVASFGYCPVVTLSASASLPLSAADFPVVYASGIAGIAGPSPEELADDLEPLFDLILSEVQGPTVQVGLRLRLYSGDARQRAGVWGVEGWLGWFGWRALEGWSRPPRTH